MATKRPHENSKSPISCRGIHMLALSGVGVLSIYVKDGLSHYQNFEDGCREKTE